ncbi:hypothetical protein D3C75_1241530 [compost metagenome]
MRRNGTSADIGECLNLNAAQPHQYFINISGFLGIEQKLQIIINRLHPRTQLLVLLSGQITDVLAHRYNGTGNEQLFVTVLILHLEQSGG